VYNLPFKQGDAKWKSYKSAKDRIKALQIPDSVISHIPTEQLLELCLDFPYLTDMYAFNDPKRGYEYLISEFNGFYEFLRRNDATNHLLNKYGRIETAVPVLSRASSIEKGNYSFKCDLLLRLIQDIESKKGLSKEHKELFYIQTEKNKKVINSNPELYGTMCKEAILLNSKNASAQHRASWYEGEIINFYDGRKYRLSARHTPRYSEVIAGELITPDYDFNTKLSLAHNVEQNYNVTVVEPATARYNCHAYAWHMHEGHENDLVWIGTKTSSDEDIFWEDNSYYSVPSSEATHISYSNDHSAIRLGNGLYRSKWGALPLVEHDSLDVPTGVFGYGIPVGFYKRREPLGISGNSLISSNVTYSIRTFNSGYTVEWNLSDNYYNQHCLQQNYPEANQCTITRDPYQNMTDATLTAIVKYNGVAIDTLTKSGLYAYNDFYGHYTCDTISGIIDYTHTFYVRPGYATFISSPNLVNATVSYDPAGTTPLYLYLEPTQWRLSFTTPINNNGIPVILEIDDVIGNHYQLYAMPRGSFYFSIAYEGDYVNITLENDDEKALKTMAIEQPWSYEIRSASMGALKASKSINTRSTTISTVGWPKGVYIIKAKIGKEEVTEKIVVK